MQKMSWFRPFSFAFLLGMVGTPLVGCGGVETEPVGVENTDAELEVLETEEYIQGEMEQQR